MTVSAFVGDILCHASVSEVTPICTQANDCGEYTSAPGSQIGPGPDPAGEGLRDTISVSGTGVDEVLTDLDVVIVAQHTYMGDMDVFLMGPNGQEVELFTDVCSFEDNADVRLDDDAEISIVDGCVSGEVPTLYGTFSPEGSLADFNYTDFNGDWVLRIADDVGGDQGTLISWCLIPTFSPVTCDAPSVDVVLTNADGVPYENCVTPGQIVKAQVTVSGGTGNTQFKVSVNGNDPDTLDQGVSAELSPIFAPDNDLNIQVVGLSDLTCPANLTVDGVPICSATDDCGEFSNSPGKAIGPDADAVGEGTRDTITVSGFDGQVVDDLNIALKINHTSVADLDIFLETPDGVEYELFSDVCGSGDNIDILLDDEAAFILSDGCVSGQVPVLYGSFATLNANIAAFEGSTLNGDWVLRIRDDAGGDGGELVQWCLIPTGVVQSCQPADISLELVDGDGILLDENSCVDPGEEVFVRATISGGTLNTSFKVTANGNDPDTLDINVPEVLTPGFQVGDSVVVSILGLQDATCPSNNGIAVNVSECSQTDACGPYSSSPELAIDNASLPFFGLIAYTDTITVSGVDETLSIADLNVAINISHTYIGDVQLTLKSPAGTEVQLIASSSCSLDDLNALFDDEADGAFACANTYGVFTPSQALSAFNGEDFNGDWVLTIEDTFTGIDFGTLHQWCLIPELAALADINGSVSGVIAACSPINATVSIYDAETSDFISEVVVDVDGSTGEFTVPGLEVGTYDIYLKLDNHLRVVQSDVEAIAGENAVDFGAMTSGDVDNDNSVTALDFQTLSNVLFSVEGDANFNSDADLDCSGVVNALDFQILSNSFFLSGVALPNAE